VSQIVFRDQDDRVKKAIDLEAISHPAIAAEGDLVAVAHFGWPNTLRTYRISTGELVAKRAIVARSDGPVLQPLFEPFFDLAVSRGEVLLLSSEFTASRVERLSSALTRRAAYVRREHPSTRTFQPAQDRLAVSGEGVWVSWNDRVERLSRELRRAERFELASAADRGGAAPRLAVDPASGRVVSDDGRIAASFGKELVPALVFGREAWHETDELELRQDRVTDVIWAFGRAVIVRDAPGLGVTVIEPFE
jgi:hypothetical protein